jgi:O-antigen/teichoic acid export membrane protein
VTASQGLSDSASGINDPTIDVAKRSVRSSVLLTAGNLTTTIVAVVASLLIARLLGPEGYGAFSLTITISILFAIFVDFGAVYAIQHNAAYYISKGDIATARRMTKSAIIFTLITGSILSFISFVLAPQLSLFVLHRVSLTPYVQIASVLILSQAIFNVTSIAFLGWGSPGYLSGMYVSQAILKLVIAPTLIVLGFGVLGAIVGHVVSYALIALVGVLAIYALKLRSIRSSNQVSNGSEVQSLEQKAAGNTDGKEQKTPSKNSFNTFVADVKEITSYGIPAYIGNGLYQFAIASFVLFLLSAFVSNTEIGYYSAAYNAAQPIVIVSSAIGLSLFSAFSSLDGMNKDSRSMFGYSVTYVSLVLMPLVLFAVGASGAIITTFYGSSYAPSAAIFPYLALSYLPAALGLTIFPSFFNGIGRTKLTLIVQVASSITVLLLAPVLELMGLAISGVIYALIAASLISALVGTYLVSHYANSHINYRAAARIFLASDISFVGIYLFQIAFHLEHLEALALDSIIFFGIYFNLIPILRALSLDDFERLRASSASLGSVKKPIELILAYETFLMKKTAALSESKT